MAETSGIPITLEVPITHANARLTVHGRALLVRRVRSDRRPVAHVAKELGVSRHCAHRWLARFDAGVITFAGLAIFALSLRLREEGKPT